MYTQSQSFPVLDCWCHKQYSCCTFVCRYTLYHCVSCPVFMETKHHNCFYFRIDKIQKDCKSTQIILIQLYLLKNGNQLQQLTSTGISQSLILVLFYGPQKKAFQLFIYIHCISKLCQITQIPLQVFWLYLTMTESKVCIKEAKYSCQTNS